MLREIVTFFLELSTEHDDVCRVCILGKYDNVSFPGSVNILDGVLQLINSNIFIPMSTISIIGYEYLITFIDDYSRKPWIYFLKTKDEVFNGFWEFKPLVENVTGKWIKVLW